MKFRFPKPASENFRESISMLAPYEIILSAFFLCGAILGNYTAFSVKPDALLKFSQISGGQAIFIRQSINLWFSLFNSFKYPIFICLLGFFIFGVFLIPFVFCAKGFGFAFCLSCFYRAAGFKGLSLASCALLIQNISLLPLLFIFSAQSAVLSKSLLFNFAKTREVSAKPPPYYFVIFGSCIFIGILSFLFEILILPSLLPLF